MLGRHAYALCAARLACELTDHRNSDCLDTLARVHFERGEFADAVKWQEVAIEHIEADDDETACREALARYRAAVAGEPEDGEEPAASDAPTVP